MDQATIASAMSKAVGEPESGILHDAIPGMAAAVAALLGVEGPKQGQGATAKPKQEARVVKADETR
jgi:hypothetical protein